MKKFLLIKKDLTLIIGFFFGIILLNLFLPKNKNSFNDLAYEEYTTRAMGYANGERVHCNDLDDIYLCVESYKKNGNDNPVILWFGNSQLHSINSYTQGDETASSLLHMALRKKGYYLITFSQPNANLQEHYLLFSYLLNQFPVKNLILSTVYDDMREDEIRTSINKTLEDAYVLNEVDKTTIGKNLIINYKKKYLINNDTIAREETNHDYWENLINKKLEKIWPLWSERDLLRGHLFYNLYLLRNTILGIDATTIRKKILGPYIKNMTAFKEILNLAEKKKIGILVYIQPIRNDMKIPYDLNEYNLFKKEIATISEISGAYFSNLENIVPNEFWGQTASINLKNYKDLDFMHFQAEGHQLLSKNILYEFNKINK
jgi:hypothetical protein